MKSTTSPKYSEWRVREEDAPTLISEFKHFLSFAQWYQWPIGLLGVALMAGSNWLTGFSESVAEISGMLIFVVGIQMTRRRAKPQVVAIGPTPLPQNHFPVEMEIRTRGVLVGKDQGIVAFINGWMHFRGQGCEFRIHLSDVRKWIDPSTTRKFVALQINDLKVELFSFTTFAGADGKLVELGEEPFTAWRAWLQGSATGAGESVLPPRRLHPFLPGYVVINSLLGGCSCALLAALLMGATSWNSERFLLTHAGLFFALAASPVAAMMLFAFGRIAILNRYDQRVRRLEQAEAPTL